MPYWLNCRDAEKQQKVKKNASKTAAVLRDHHHGDNSKLGAQRRAPGESSRTREVLDLVWPQFSIRNSQKGESVN